MIEHTRFDPDWASRDKGEWGEQMILTLLTLLGHSVIRTAASDGRAPLIRKVDEGIRVPDLLVADLMCFVEVKVRGSCYEYDQDRRISIRQEAVEDYKEVHEEYAPVIIMVIVPSEGLLLCRRADELEPNDSTTGAGKDEDDKHWYSVDRFNSINLPEIAPSND